MAEALNLPFLDLDEWIETRAGLSIPAIFEREGESGFRRRESAALVDAVEGQAGVVALGGGALLNPTNRARAEKAGRVLCLMASLEVLLARLESDSTERPLLEGGKAARLRELLKTREAHYASFQLSLDTEGRNPFEVAWEAQVLLGAFHVRGMGDGYDVRVVAGGLHDVGDTFQASGLQGPVGLVSDQNVGSLYADSVAASLRRSGYETHVVQIPPGEEHKSLDSAVTLWDAFLAGGLDRSSTVLALGGGVVGDLAGFAGAVFMRGLRWVNLPTSLLAMVDASLGGKTGVDLPQGKNLIGAFHPPAAVLVDPKALMTLPLVELRSGLAEVVKHGVIADPKLFDLCAQGWEVVTRDWEAVVRRAMAVKIRVIEEDPYEKGRRAELNFGHTIGHAVEHASAYQIRHGEAVAIGMATEARLARRLRMSETGLTETLVRVLQGLSLPTEIPPDIDKGVILAALRVDKKRRAGRVRWALPRRIGEVQAGVEIENLENEVAKLW
jgi:3-dehydroquinate synthase